MISCACSIILCLLCCVLIEPPADSCLGIKYRSCSIILCLFRSVPIEPPADSCAGTCGPVSRSQHILCVLCVLGTTTSLLVSTGRSLVVIEATT